MRRPRNAFMFSPDGAAGGSIDQTFGVLENVRPELAQAEAGERARKAEAKAPKRALELARPVLDAELIDEQAPANQDPNPAPEADGKKKTEAARSDAPPAAVDDDSGRDPESPDEAEADLAALLDKYQGNPRSLAKAVRGLRTLQTQTAEDRNKLIEQVETLVQLVDNDYDFVDGKPVLKPSTAARQLSAQRGGGRAPFQAPTEAQVRAEVEAEFKQQAGEAVQEDQLPRFLEVMRPLIDRHVKERLTTAQTQAQAQRIQMLSEVGGVVQRHMQAHPEDEKLLPEIDKIYGGIPEELRSAAVLDEWLPFGEMADLVRLKTRLPEIVKKAYELGKKHRGNAGTPAEAGAPGRSRPTAPTGRTSQEDADRQFKDSIIRGGSGLPSIDSIFAR